MSILLKFTLLKELKTVGVEMYKLILIVAFMCFQFNYTAQSKMNVLILNIDDLKPSLRCYGDEFAITPNIDSLAKRGTVFLANYCQQAVCSASRVSMYTGMRPDSTGIHDLHTHMRDINPDILTLPQYMKQNGYDSIGYGKILHGAKNDDLEHSWSERYDKELPYNNDHEPPVIGKFQSPDLHDVLNSYKQKNKRFQQGKFLAMLKKNDLYPAI